MVSQKNGTKIITTTIILYFSKGSLTLSPKFKEKLSTKRPKIQELQQLPSKHNFPKELQVPLFFKWIIFFWWNKPQIYRCFLTISTIALLKKNSYKTWLRTTWMFMENWFRKLKMKIKEKEFKAPEKYSIKLQWYECFVLLWLAHWQIKYRK